MSARGFTLVELLLAMLVTIAVASVVVALSLPMRATFDRTVAAADLMVRGRGLERVIAELRESGHAASAIHGASVADVWPVVTVQSALDNPGAAEPWSALRISYVPADAGQAVLAESVAAGARTITLRTASQCPGTREICGFENDVPAVLFDDTRAERVFIQIANTDGTVGLRAGLGSAYAGGAVLVQVREVAYGLRRLSDGSSQLVRTSDDGAEQPLVDRVVRFEARLMGRGDPPELSTAPDARPSYGPRPPPSTADDPRDVWPAGENCTIALDADGHQVPRLSALAPRASLVQLTAEQITDGPWCADDASAARFDADLLRVARVDLVLRVEAPASFRGSLATLFQRPGAARRAADWIPDMEIRASVAFRSH